MNQGTHPEELPAEVLDDVASVVGAEVTLLSRLPGGVNGGAMRVQLAGRANAVLKAVPRAHPNHLDETLRAQRVVEHMRRRGYPTPAWLGVGATATHVWHLMDFVDAAPAPELTPSLVEQLMEIIELQAGQASEPYDHWSYAWRVATGQESAVAGLDFNETPEQSLLRQSVAGLSGYSSVVSALVERLRLVCADVPPPREAPDMVHADLSTPSNVLVRDGAVVAVVDIGNAGSGTRATRSHHPRVVHLPGSAAGRCPKAAVDENPRPGRLGGGGGARSDTDPPHARDPHPSRAPRCRSRGGQARPSRPRRAERASLTVAGGDGVRNGDLRLLSAGITRNIHLEAENGALREFVEQLQSQVGELQERIVEVERKIRRSCRSTPWASARRWCRQAASPHRRAGPAPRFEAARFRRASRPSADTPAARHATARSSPCSRAAMFASTRSDAAHARSSTATRRTRRAISRTP